MSLLRDLADRLDVVPVGVYDESRVIRRRIVLSQSRLPVVLAARGHRAFIELPHGAPGARLEREMQRARALVGPGDPEDRGAWRPEAGVSGFGIARLQAEAERGERRLVEADALLQ